MGGHTFSPVYSYNVLETLTYSVQVICVLFAPFIVGLKTPIIRL